eukprot:5977732-Pleurochrysis_carterae.AAC.1
MGTGSTPHGAWLLIRPLRSPAAQKPGASSVPPRWHANNPPPMPAFVYSSFCRDCCVDCLEAAA